MRIRLLLAIGLVVCAVACARHVVVDPEAVGRLNDPAWTIKSEPRAAAPVAR